MSSQSQQDISSFRGPKVVLFDMDGVLYDSMPNHGVAWQRAMKEFGIHFTLEDSYATEGARGVDSTGGLRDGILPFHDMHILIAMTHQIGHLRG